MAAPTPVRKQSCLTAMADDCQHYPSFWGSSMRIKIGLTLTLSALSLSGVQAQEKAAGPLPPAEAAKLFGDLPTVMQVSLSPDGENVAYISPLGNRGSALLIAPTREGASPKGVLKTSGDADTLMWCGWDTPQRLVCKAGAVAKEWGYLLGATSLFAINSDGSNLKTLTAKQDGENALYIDLRGGAIVDWLPSDPGHVLMMRAYVPEERVGSLISKRAAGMGVDRIDINSGSAKRVESARLDAVEYISDGNSNVRILGVMPNVGATGQISDTITYSYRDAQSRELRPLGKYNFLTEEGFNPFAVDPRTNRAIGLKKIDGRKAAVSVVLDGSGMTSVMFSHPEVDIDGFVYAGPKREVVGATFATEKRQVIVTDGKYRQMTTALGRALGGKTVFVADETFDGSRLLIWAGSDTDAGRYYLYAPAEKKLRPLLDERPGLTGIALSQVKPVRYPAADGTMIPAYLTLPPGKADAKGMPAIVMPHGGPSARDEWGFDWLAQFFANQGYAVIQPNFRGSSGYGDAWYKNNGFQSWRTAIGDVADAGRWLTGTQGADAKRLSIVGWSYGGYAALQAGVIAPGLFKKIVAVAPVTDLAQLKSEESRSSAGRVNRDFIGSGPHIREGSPAQNAASITAPVLMFHGSYDQNVNIDQARTMRKALQGAGKTVELIEYPGLAHGLAARDARRDMLNRAAAFLAR